MKQKIGDIAQFLDISEPTVRVWTTEFADFLSGQATPDKGKTRWYTDKDLQVLFYAKQMRDQNVGYEEIRERLVDGQHLTIVPASIYDEQLFTASFVTQIQSQLHKVIETLENERDYLRSQLDEQAKKLETERQIRLELEKKVSRLESQIDMSDNRS